MAKKTNHRGSGRFPSQPVVGTSKATGEEFYFSSIQETKEQGFNPQTISLCLKGKLKQTGGFTWKKWEKLDT